MGRWKGKRATPHVNAAGKSEIQVADVAQLANIRPPREWWLQTLEPRQPSLRIMVGGAVGASMGQARRGTYLVPRRSKRERAAPVVGRPEQLLSDGLATSDELDRVLV